MKTYCRERGTVAVTFSTLKTVAHFSIRYPSGLKKPTIRRASGMRVLNFDGHASLSEIGKNLETAPAVPRKRASRQS